MNQQIAVVDDEADIVELEEQALKKEGFLVSAYFSGDRMLDDLLKAKKVFSLILLDIMLPGFSGIEILKQLKNNPDYESYKSVPVILVSAKDGEIDKVLGLELGADDYISKPFSPRELTARVKAVLRRSEEKSLSSEPGNKIKIAGIVIDEKKFLVTADGKPVDLTTAEFKILSVLSRRKGWVFERNKLIDMIWGGDKYVTDRTIDVHIKHLREKLGDCGYVVKTVRGVGYKADEEK